MHTIKGHVLAIKSGEQLAVSAGFRVAGKSRWPTQVKLQEERITSHARMLQNDEEKFEQPHTSVREKKQN